MTETEKLYGLLAKLVEFIETPEIQAVIDGAYDPSIYHHEAIAMLDNKFGKEWRERDSGYILPA